jgi:hypothetical protein
VSGTTCSAKAIMSANTKQLDDCPCDPVDFLRLVMRGGPFYQGGGLSTKSIYPDMKLRVDAAKTLLRHEEMSARGTEPIDLEQLSLMLPS